MKICTKCKTKRPLDLFALQKGTKDGRHSQCKLCRAAYDKERYNPEKRKKEYLENHNKSKEYRRAYYKANKEDYYYRKAIRRATKLKATPKWFEADKVALIYIKAKELHCQVDHVVPLQSALVCGLHCWANLQLLPEEINKSKGNREWPDMP